MQFDNTFETILDPLKIPLIIGKSGSNLIKNINNVSISKYVKVMNDSDADDMRVSVRFDIDKASGKVISKWNNIADVEMKVFNGILKNIIKEEVLRINKMNVNTTSERNPIVYTKSKSRSSRNYVIQIDVSEMSISKMIGRKGANVLWLTDLIREETSGCGSVNVKIYQELQNKSDKIYGGITDKYEGGGQLVYIYINIQTPEKVFAQVLKSVKVYLDKLFCEEIISDSDDEVNEYEEYDKGEW